MPSEWNKVVKEQYALGKKANPASYTFKRALMDAKPIYNSVKKGVKIVADSVLKPKGRSTRRKGKSAKSRGGSAQLKGGKKKGAKKTRGKK
jgi:hypothetical protein